MRKFNKLGLFALLGLVLTACGPTTQPTTAPTSTPEPTNPTTAPDPTTTPAPEFIAPESISIIGSFNAWNADVDFTTFDEGHTWVLDSHVFKAGDEWKVRMNHNWGWTMLLLFISFCRRKQE